MTVWSKYILADFARAKASDPLYPIPGILFVILKNFNSTRREVGYDILAHSSVYFPYADFPYADSSVVRARSDETLSSLLKMVRMSLRVAERPTVIHQMS